MIVNLKLISSISLQVSSQIKLFSSIGVDLHEENISLPS